jgi:nucleotide-binding universal stress UspA family protein
MIGPLTANRKESDLMFKKVVWATDGSEAADLALPHAKTLAAEAGGELVVVHCEEFLPQAPRGGRFPVHADEDELKAKIQRQAAEIGEDGVKASLQTVTAGAGGAAHAIADVARDQHADVIVVGTRGHTALAGLLLGSVTQRLLHIAPCPVLAVPAADHHASG